MIGNFAVIGLFVGLVIALLVIALLVFEICMIISAIKNKHISENAKILWVLGMFFIHPIVAIAYFFTDYQKSHQ